jgi:ABC-type multidrug transport system fused ATPase/permease subunit
MILSLLKFLEKSGDLCIDGVDVERIPTQALRYRITTIPQDPITLPGTVRDNLMPYPGQQDDETLNEWLIKDVLAQVCLEGRIEASGGLDVPYKSLNLSHGQQQLMAMARAILHHMYVESTLIIMDEPTGSVDPLTELVLRIVIKEAFLDTTMLVVSHRAETNPDAIMVVEMEGGRVVDVKE